MANTIGEKELKNAWPVEKGLTARTTSQLNRVMFLKPSRSMVLRRDSYGVR